MKMSIDAQECLLAQVTGIFPVSNHAADDVPAQSLKARDQPFECPGFPIQDFGHQVPVVFHLDWIRTGRKRLQPDSGRGSSATVGVVNVSSVTEDGLRRSLPEMETPWIQSL